MPWCSPPMMKHCDSVSPSYNLSLLSSLSLLLQIILKRFCCFLLGLCLQGTYTVLLIHVQDQISEEIPQICKIMAQTRGELTFQVTTVAAKIRSLLTFFIGGHLKRERESKPLTSLTHFQQALTEVEGWLWLCSTLVLLSAVAWWSLKRDLCSWCLTIIVISHSYR